MFTQRPLHEVCMGSVQCATASRPASPIGLLEPVQPARAAAANNAANREDIRRVTSNLCGDDAAHRAATAPPRLHRCRWECGGWVARACLLVQRSRPIKHFSSPANRNVCAESMRPPSDCTGMHRTRCVRRTARKPAINWQRGASSAATAREPRRSRRAGKHGATRRAGAHTALCMLGHFSLRLAPGSTVRSRTTRARRPARVRPPREQSSPLVANELDERAAHCSITGTRMSPRAPARRARTDPPCWLIVWRRSRVTSARIPRCIARS
jgi:hypothetical protein